MQQVWNPIMKTPLESLASPLMKLAAVTPELRHCSASRSTQITGATAGKHPEVLPAGHHPDFRENPQEISESESENGVSVSLLDT